MGFCKNCRFWMTQDVTVRYERDTRADEAAAILGSGGECADALAALRRPLKTVGEYSRCYRPADQTYDLLRTRCDFGCIHWEAEKP
jgi:hypothetical protein